MLTGIPALLALGTFTSTAVPAWYDTMDPANANSSDGQVDSGYFRHVSIVLPAGTVSKIRVRLGVVTFDGTGFRVALYDNSNALLANTNTTINIADGGTWKEVTVTGTVVAAGTYVVSWTALSGASEVTYRYLSASGVTLTDTPSGGYFSFPYNPQDHTGEFTVHSGIDAVGIYVTP